ASGHVQGFTDPMVDCKKCKGRWRADQLPETKCPQGGPHDYTEARTFNLRLAATRLGAQTALPHQAELTAFLD
ncbi:MAG: hypothetical protein HC822_02000, partial [Oscillochloris sp.]|nr:hypothetical protein [Oscillochloris sp.]